MKRDREIVDERQNNIMSLLRDQKEVRVDILAEKFGVSLMTIRRDLQCLEDKGLITRFYGGASLKSRDIASDTQLCRDMIGRYAASLVSEGDSLFINGSSTALGMLAYLEQNDLHIFTNNGKAVVQQVNPNIELTISGGDVQGDSGILTGDAALRNLLAMHADKAFIGCTGISTGGELLCGIPMELPINETMIEHSDEYYILADHTKIGVAGNYASWHLEKMGTVVTDSKAPLDVIKQLRSIGMKVIQVS